MRKEGPRVPVLDCPHEELCAKTYSSPTDQQLHTESGFASLDEACSAMIGSSGHRSFDIHCWSSLSLLGAQSVSERCSKVPVGSHANSLIFGPCPSPNTSTPSKSTLVSPLASSSNKKL